MDTGENMKLCGYKRGVEKNRLALTPTNFRWSQHLEPNLTGCVFMKKGGERQDDQEQSYTKCISNASSMCQRFLAIGIKERLMDLSGNENNN